MHSQSDFLTIIRIARKNDVKVTVWVATPCTSGCSWKHVNAAKGFTTGDKVLSSKLIKAADKVCRRARLLGGDYVWELPETCDLWKDWRVRALPSSQWHFMPVSASAVGWTAFQMGKVVTIKKRWRLWTTHPSIAAAFAPYQQDPNASAKTFVQCSGTVAKESAHYPQKFA